MALSFWFRVRSTVSVSDAFLFLIRFRELLEATGPGVGLVTATDPPVIHERVRPPRNILTVSLVEAICWESGGGTVFD